MSYSTPSHPPSSFHMPRSSPQATLHVVQQPVRARMCGLGDKDRRQITPPPLVQLKLYDHAGHELTNVRDLNVSFYAVIVELYSADSTENLSIMSRPSRYTETAGYPSASTLSSSVGPTRNLIGSLVATAQKLRDLNEELGIWFTFQDLSIRSEGIFTLKFSFVNLASTGLDGNLEGAPIICSTFSESFKSYSAKTFPGVIETTPLSRHFALQGVRLSVRRDKRDAPSKPSKE